MKLTVFECLILCSYNKLPQFSNLKQYRFIIGQKFNNGGLIPDLGRSHMLAQLSPCATTTKSTCSGAHVPQEKPPQEEAHAPQIQSTPYSPQLEKSPCSNKDPVQPKQMQIDSSQHSFPP